jgi:hypothetical protein
MSAATARRSMAIDCAVDAGPSSISESGWQ